MSVARLFPFLKWFPVTRDTLRADAVAGITVALVLVPQSMAYAQLAGLPVVYGLYASFVPVIVAALWGSLNQLHTGPVAMLSLMSAAALVPLASPGSPDFVELSIMLAFAVGVLRLLLGIFRLGVIVNFLSQPVVVGFTNAAALIIGLSQLSKLLGVPMPRTESFLADLWTVMGQAATTHWPTLAFALGALALILFLKRVAPNAPGILIAVVTATVVSWAVGFERTASVPLSGIEDARFRELLSEYQTVQEARKRAEQELASLASQVRGPEDAARQQAEQRMQTLRERQNELKRRADELRIALHARALTRVEIADGGVRFVSAQRPLDPGRELSQGWRFVRVEGESVVLSGGGAVVGEIPAGLPTPSVPELRWDVLLGLLPEALVMALIGFMEATSISKAIASRTRQRIDTSQELIGQGMANIAGSFFSSYVVSGSFSRSALSARAGARTGLAAIISAFGVMLVLLFLTPALYHLPQSVLAIIVMLAVFGLIDFKSLRHAWQVQRQDAIAGVATFVATLAMAPDLAGGILLGVALTVILYLVRNMRPRAEILGRHPDGTLGGIRTHGLEPLSECFVPVRFDGSLTFINVAYFEDIVLKARAEFPNARAILVIGSGINEIDASGEEAIRELARRLREAGVELMFSSLKQQVRSVLQRAGLVEFLGPENFFKTKQNALETLQARSESGCQGVAQTT